MGCLPYFKFYPADWLADRRVRDMSPGARGLYWDLLSLAWDEGGIPVDPTTLANYLRIRPATFARLWAEIEDCWIHGPEGKLVNPRQEREREEAMRVYQQRVEAGRKGGRPGKQTETVRKANG